MCDHYECDHFTPEETAARVAALNANAATPPVRVGDRVRMTGQMMDDPDPVPVGMQGTVTWVGQWTDELTKQIGVRWDNHSTLGLLHTDPYEVVPAGRVDTID